MALALTACGQETWETSTEAQLLVPEDVEIQWDETFNGSNDGLAALVPVDIMVYEPGTGEPLVGWAVRVLSDDTDVAILGLDDVEVVSTEGCKDCVITWDAHRDRYFEVLGDSTDGMTLLTDEDGLVRVVVQVDAFPVNPRESDYVSVGVSVGAGAHEESFYLVPR